MQARRWITMFALVLAVAACDEDADDGAGPSESRSFTVAMSGANERPNPVNPAGTGTATFTLDAAESTLSYTISVSGMTSTITAAHIHLGGANVAGSVIVPLTTPVNGQQVAGTITNATALSLGLSFKSLIALMRTGDVYVNVHTTTNPAGEIRGQLQAAS